MGYRRTLSLDVPFAEAVTRTKEGLPEPGFRDPVGDRRPDHAPGQARGGDGALRHPGRLQSRPDPSGVGGGAWRRGPSALQRRRQRYEGSTVQVLDPQVMASVTGLPSL